jgi:hypothetical protein
MELLIIIFVVFPLVLYLGYTSSRGSTKRPFSAEQAFHPFKVTLLKEFPHGAAVYRVTNKQGEHFIGLRKLDTSGTQNRNTYHQLDRTMLENLDIAIEKAWPNA